MKTIEELIAGHPIMNLENIQHGGTDSTARIHTPAEFRELLLGIALSVNNKTCHGPEAKP